MNDGELLSIGTGIVNVTIHCTDIAPIAVNDSLTINEDGSGSVEVIANDSDADTGDVVSLSGIVTQGVNGIASISGNSIVYVSNADYCGTDEITYQSKDVYGPTGSNIGIVSITILCVNDLPITSG
mgnify:CR=1 FL=1